MYECVNIEVLKGKTLTAVQGKVGDDELFFVTSEGETYKMYHDQNCCEVVYVEDIVGDLQDLVDSPILEAREDSYSDGESIDHYDDSFTWTFYNITTAKGHVTIRWYGTSNGWYSEDVSFMLIPGIPN